MGGILRFKYFKPDLSILKAAPFCRSRFQSFRSIGERLKRIQSTLFFTQLKVLSVRTMLAFYEIPSKLPLFTPLIVLGLGKPTMWWSLSSPLTVVVSRVHSQYWERKGHSPSLLATETELRILKWMDQKRRNQVKAWFNQGSNSFD